jgi:radical SAM/Cys-rich protein
MSFDGTLKSAGLEALSRQSVTTVQVNVGKVCNQACLHCHVDAGPLRTESMSAETARRVIELVLASPGVETVDITGGAPELNPNFRWLVEESRCAGRHVIDRCNLTVLFEPGQQDLGQFLAQNRAEIIASLPCYTRDNVDRQRGRGAFDKSIAALRLLNELGYGVESGLRLNLVYNPLGPSLPPPQAALEADYKRRLREDFGIEFHSLYTLTNMPINRFADSLVHIGKADSYQDLLERSFNPDTIPSVMCRSLVSIGHDGALYDCDFNQMLEITADGHRTVWDIGSFDELAGVRIRTGRHCFGCTAGAGSSCGGSLLN